MKITTTLAAIGDQILYAGQLGPPGPRPELTPLAVVFEPAGTNAVIHSITDMRDDKRLSPSQRMLFNIKVACLDYYRTHEELLDAYSQAK